MRSLITLFFILATINIGLSQNRENKSYRPVYIDVDLSYFVFTFDAGISGGVMFNENVGLGLGLSYTQRFNFNRRSKNFTAIGLQLKTNSINKKFFAKHEIGFLPTYKQNYYDRDDSAEHIASFQPYLKAQYGIRFGEVFNISAGATLVPIVKEEGYRIEKRNNGFVVLNLMIGFNFAAGKRKIKR